MPAPVHRMLNVTDWRLWVSGCMCDLSECYFGVNRPDSMIDIAGTHPGRYQFARVATLS